MATIYILDGSLGIREKISESLRQRNHHVEGFDTIAAVEKALGYREPDLMIVEAQLHDGDGFQFVKSLKTHACLPVIFATFRSSCLDRIQGFEVGADDYVVKPFSTQELVLRSEAILRRYHR